MNPILTRRRVSSSVVAVAATILLAGCGAGAADDTAPVGAIDTTNSEIQQLADKASQAGEREVVIYGPFVNSYKAVYAEFEKKFKVKVVAQPLFGAELDAKLGAEFATGQHLADLVHTGATDLQQLGEQKRMQAYRPSAAKELDAQYFDSADLFGYPAMSPYGLTYNTEKVTKDQVPTSLNDLTDPKWAGVVGIGDPLTASTTTDTITRLTEVGQIDEAWLTAFAKNAKVIPTQTTLANDVATGKLSLSPWLAHSFYAQLKAKGAPLGFTIIPNSSIVVGAGMGLLEGAPHPNAAKLLEAWMYSPQAQELIVSKTYSYGVTKDAPELPGLPPLSSFPKELQHVASPDLADRTKKTLAVTKTIF